MTTSLCPNTLTTPFSGRVSAWKKILQRRPFWAGSRPLWAGGEGVFHRRPGVQSTLRRLVQLRRIQLHGVQCRPLPVHHRWSWLPARLSPESWHADLLPPSLRCRSDHYMQVLNCKQHCAVELTSHSSKNEPFKDFLPSHFNYLQFSYYNSEFVCQSIYRTCPLWWLRVRRVKCSFFQLLKGEGRVASWTSGHIF